MATIYQDLGFLILGSRLRRMSEYFLSEVNKVYQDLGIPFEASWFPLFYMLSNQKQVSIRQVADELMTSHSAVSQLVTKLKEKNLITTDALAQDKRVQVIGLTKKGQALKKKLLPVWDGISESMALMEKSYPDVAHFLPAVANLEAHFEAQPLSEIILEKVAKPKVKKQARG
ncbi:MarR family protein [Arachidicoccus rhizosphaerae]|uniref:MarR family protein n=1 Tax=Arachidicoccus rhizosphaerae TaxID=551991 RepID=A0A1H3YEI9_9BACT|nr:MarR family transcriptional regulator [Arachidicoccus rhizosphaerae]SEA09963.1 MarR family protein [Arachidicoccus rhizosphaerae]